ncbi:hypothetical protein EB118_16955 [bacterium]|nr:hypothetical protein [bacterium]
MKDLTTTQVPTTALRDPEKDPVALLYSNVFCNVFCTSSSAVLSMMTHDVHDAPHDVHGAGPPAVPLINPATLFSYSPSELDFLLAELRSAVPGKDQGYYMDIFRRYEQAVYDEILVGRVKGRNLGLVYPQVYMSYEKIKKKLGRFGPRGNQKYWFYWFQNVLPIVRKIKEGYSIPKGKSMFTIAEVIRDLDSKGSSRSYFEQFSDDELFKTPIDMASLKAYINRTRSDVLPEAERLYAQDPKNNKKYLKKIQHNLQYAALILSIAEENDGVLPQQRRRSQFGREYLIGVNLQSASKQVRHAALGDCWSIDIESAALNWKYHVVKLITPDRTWPVLLDYFDRKDSIREELSLRIFDRRENKNDIKRVITAMVFGARLSGSEGWQYLGKDAMGRNKFRAYTAITNLIQDRERRTQLKNDPWLREFDLCQKQMDQIIFEAVRHEPFVEKNKEIFIGEGKSRLQPGKVLAYMYQRSEFDLLSQMCAQIQEYTPNNQILLCCHDGLYTRYKPDLASLQTLVQDTWHEAGIGSEQIRRQRDLSEQWEFELAHKQHMEQEYRLAEEKLGRAIPRPRAFKALFSSKNEDYDAGYDDGTQAYMDPTQDPDAWWERQVLDYKEMSEEERSELDPEYKEQLAIMAPYYKLYR